MKIKFDKILGRIREQDVDNGSGMINLDGGSASSIYLITQNIDGGTA